MLPIDCHDFRFSLADDTDASHFLRFHFSARLHFHYHFLMTPLHTWIHYTQMPHFRWGLYRAISHSHWGQIYTLAFCLLLRRHYFIFIIADTYRHYAIAITPFSRHYAFQLSLLIRWCWPLHYAISWYITCRHCQIAIIFAAFHADAADNYAVSMIMIIFFSFHFAIDYLHYFIIIFDCHWLLFIYDYISFHFEPLSFFIISMQPLFHAISCFHFMLWLIFIFIIDISLLFYFID
jgi:hypothetical protein